MAELEKVRMSASKQAAVDGRTLAELRDQVVKIEEENRQVNELSGEVRRERDQLKTKADDLQRQLETARQNLASRDDLLNSTMARAASLEKREQDLTDANRVALGEIRDLLSRPSNSA